LAILTGIPLPLSLSRTSRYSSGSSSTSNAFFVIGDEVITAPLDSGTILPGITRNSVIQLLTKWGIQVSERKLSIDEIVAASKNGALKEIFAPNWCQDFSTPLEMTRKVLQIPIFSSCSYNRCRGGFHIRPKGFWTSMGQNP